MTVRTPLWVRAFLVLMAISLALSITMLSAVELNITTVVIVSAITLMILGATFLIAFWLATWMNQPRVGYAPSQRSRNADRDEIARLLREVADRDRRINDLEAAVYYLRSESIRTNPPPPPIRATDDIRRTAVHPQVQPDRYPAPASRTGTHPRIRTDHAPAISVHQSGIHPPLDRTGTFHAVETVTHRAVSVDGQNGNGHYENGSRRNGNGHTGNGHNGNGKGHSNGTQRKVKQPTLKPKSIPGQTVRYTAVRFGSPAGSQLRNARRNNKRDGGNTSV